MHTRHDGIMEMERCVSGPVLVSNIHVACRGVGWGLGLKALVVLLVAAKRLFEPGDAALALHEVLVEPQCHLGVLAVALFPRAIVWEVVHLLVAAGLAPCGHPA